MLGLMGSFQTPTIHALEQGMGPSRIASTILASGYLAVAILMLFLYPSREAVIAFVALVLILALALGMIWNGDQWGGRGVGLSVFGISRYTPGCGVALIGWALLMIPAAVGLLVIWIHWSN